MTAMPKVIVITGSSDGIGAEMARQLAKKYGAQLSLVLAARNQALLQSVAGQCASYGSTTLVVKTDVAIESQCRALIVNTIAKFGRLDGLINNAGKSAHALLEEVEDLAWYEDLTPTV